MGIYMKFGTIDGDATQIVRCSAGDPTPKVLKQTGWIPLESFDWSIASAITTKAGNAGSPTRGPKNPDVRDIVVKKRTDLSSGDLLRILCEDTKGQDCTIVFVRTGDPGEIYLQYELKNTLIKELKWGECTREEDRPHETLTLTFTDLMMSVWRIAKSNETYESEEECKGGAPIRYPVHKDPGATSGQGAGSHNGGHSGHHFGP